MTYFFTILPHDQLENRNTVMILDDNIFILKKHLVKTTFIIVQKGQMGWTHILQLSNAFSQTILSYRFHRYIGTERVQNIYRNMHLLINIYIQYRSFKTMKSKLRGPTCLFTHVIYRVKKIEHSEFNQFCFISQILKKLTQI